MGLEPILQALIFGGAIAFALIAALLAFRRTRRFAAIALPLSVVIAAIPPLLMLPLKYPSHYLIWLLVFSLPAIAVSSLIAAGVVLWRRKHGSIGSA